MNKAQVDFRFCPGRSDMIKDVNCRQSHRHSRIIDIPNRTHYIGMARRFPTKREMNRVAFRTRTNHVKMDSWFHHGGIQGEIHHEHVYAGNTENTQVLFVGVLPDQLAHFFLADSAGFRDPRQL